MQSAASGPFLSSDYFDARFHNDRAAADCRVIGGGANQLAQARIVQTGFGRDAHVTVKFAGTFEQAGGIGEFGSTLEAKIYVIAPCNHRAEGFLETAGEGEGVDDGIRNVVHCLAGGRSFFKDAGAGGEKQLTDAGVVAREKFQ